MASHVASLWNRGLVQLGNDLFATLRLRDRPGRDGCQSALWDCFEGCIFNMAANSNKGAKAEEEMKSQEIDVLGWKLLEPTQYCTVSILKRWLASRGAKLPGKRLKEFIKRCDSVIRTILGDRGAVSLAGRKGATKVFTHRRKSPSVPTLTKSQTVKRMLAPDWAQKIICIIVQSANSFSLVLFVSLYTTAIISPQLPCSFTKPSYPETKELPMSRKKFRMLSAGTIQFALTKFCFWLITIYRK